MSTNAYWSTVTGFYDTHPINEQQILEKLQQDGVELDTLTEDILQNYDQDHYGGTAANDALASAARIDASTHVLDVCSGMGGPSRYLAHNLGCRVSGIDLTQSRVDGATRLTGLTGLTHLVDFRQGNALEMPFEDGKFDVVVSQEGFCHIPDKARLIPECVRVLKPGGRLAFTDILASSATTSATRERLLEGMNFPELITLDDYRGLLEKEGCQVEVENLSGHWQEILTERLAMYRSLKDQTVEQFGQERFEKWDDAYSFFVGLYESGELEGGRFVATRPAP